MALGPVRTRDLMTSAALGLLFALSPLPIAGTAGTAHAQAAAPEAASLISDRLEITGSDTLVASGNVEVFHKGRRLTASRITFNQATDRLQIEGPILLTEAEGSTVVLASSADLASDMTDGILSSARVVMNQQLQLAASQMQRVEGRYTHLDQVTASSCQVCINHPVPLWEIRASRVTHDQVERQIYFDNAQFRVAGVPVAWLPRLRLPDPTLDRSTGFLAPTLRTTSDLGPGVRLPYFIVIDDQRDLTLTPYLTFRDSYSMDARWRQAFRTGQITLQGAVTKDKLTDHDYRGYAFAHGGFDLGQGYKLSFDLKTTSDNAYLLDYGIMDDDRLDSRVEISRVSRNGYFSSRVIGFQSLRDSEDNDTLPSLLIDNTLHRRFSLGELGGEGGFRLQTHNHFRTSEEPLDLDGDLIADGRDMGRISARFDWRKAMHLPLGIEATALGEAHFDHYYIRQDDVWDGSYDRMHAAAGVELRWPWMKATEGGATHVIEPVVQLIWADRSGRDLPNEDSRLVEFDEGNLFALDRFPGGDAVEEGSRMNLGLTWTRFDPSGLASSLTIGRVIREEDNQQFGLASGLGGRRSDWLVATNVTWSMGLSATGRALFDDASELTKGELRLHYAGKDFGIGGSALWVRADPAENRPEATREVVFDASWKATPALTAQFLGSYDFESNRATRAGVGMVFRNECVSVDLSLSRRFTSSTSVDPTTDFGLSVDLIGFGSGKAAGPARRC